MFMHFEIQTEIKNVNVKDRRIKDRKFVKTNK